MYCSAFSVSSYSRISRSDKNRLNIGHQYWENEKHTFCSLFSFICYLREYFMYASDAPASACPESI